MAGPNKCRRYEGRVCIITASTAGIGLGIARRLAQEGASVVISSRKEKNVNDAVAQLKKEGLEAFGVVCHVGSAEHRKKLIDETIQKYGKIDVFVSNAAVNPGVGPILDMAESQLDKILEINVKVSVLLVREAAPHIPSGGSIILISSITAFNPGAPLAMYAVSKTALLGLTRGLAAELAPNVRVNCVAPGIVPTHFASALVANEASKKAMEDQTLLKRLGTPEDIAGAVAFLASDDAAYVTGETVVVAGGTQSRL
ncbi:indole-3-butyric acid response [Klebsormidium nitens]|uniref:Indole-3-butyric acid response n=1 Tax=Klebsormidium nitens TaxID=105231 RepID=A0A1Y1I8W9_KLENI|nr:indole-3-butyric acid response [Klebsormidium nitens]|eukprot:GAQ85581.1 indole-3-butyric acid response [Klebsormidium nitens]